MTVTVTRLPGGITELFNTDTGRVTFKCKAESAFMPIEAFGGIVKFNQKGAIASVTGEVTSLQSCYVIKESDEEYKEALSAVINARKEFVKTKYDEAQKEIQKLESKLASL
ncbi:MAG: hypothetical protein H2B03_04960 [Nitrosopumilaceae archaeon]|uniref:Uncharacterized protein n=1 Tax=Candidatus Nitrosomaritimum aestuariumsis TaxID=3342354 RepID=A0AC60VYY4_9ARCH|nr:hypothetical protein [Nitrosopumilaceae archaeon]